MNNPIVMTMCQQILLDLHLSCVNIIEKGNKLYEKATRYFIFISLVDLATCMCACVCACVHACTFVHLCMHLVYVYSVTLKKATMKLEISVFLMRRKPFTTNIVKI